jgi:hypothetical protein
MIDARSSEPGLDIPQIRQRFEPALTSAPQPLQAKANVAPRLVDLNTTLLRLFPPIPKIAALGIHPARARRIGANVP